MRKLNNFGFTLMEVLISLILLSFVLLGFDEMELYSLYTTNAAYYFHVGAEQINSMIELLNKMNDVEVINKQIEEWNLQNKQVLPQGEGEVRGNYPHYFLTLYWGGASHPCIETKIGMTGCIQKNIH